MTTHCYNRTKTNDLLCILHEVKNSRKLYQLHWSNGLITHFQLGHSALLLLLRYCKMKETVDLCLLLPYLKRPYRKNCYLQVLHCRAKIVPWPFYTLQKFFGLYINNGKGGNSMPKQFECTPKNKQHKMRLENFFYNLAKFVFEYSCNSRRIL